MAKNPRAGIDVALNDRPAIDGLRNLAKSFGTFSVQAAASLELARAGWQALTGAIGAVVGATAEYVQLASEQERVERRAIAAIQARTSLTQAEYEALQAANAARQQQLGIGDEVQLQLQGTLASMGVGKAQLDAATRAAIGLSQAMGMGLEEAGKIAGKALTGNVAALQEYGIRVGSVTEAQAALNRLYEQSVAQSSTLATRYEVLSANIGDLKEVLGQTVTSSGVAKDALDALSAATVQLQTFFASSDGRELVNQFFSVITVGAADAIDAMIGAYRVMQALSGERERGSLLSRAGGAGRLAMSVTPSSLLARAMGLTPGGLQGQAAEMKDAFDQLMGRGVEPLGDSPLVQTASDLADRLRAAAKSLVEIQSGLGGGAGGRGGGGGGAALPGVSVEVGEIRLSRDIQRENMVRQQAQLEAGFAAELAASQAAITREAADIQRQVDMDVLNQRNDLHRQAFELRMQTTREMTAQELEVIVAGGKAINDAQTQQMQVLGDVATSVANVVGSAVTELITAWASGADMADMTVGKFVGGIIKQLGTMAIQVGTAALLMAPLALIPGLGWLIGGPQNAPLVAAAGAALVVGGAGMVALGASMGGGSARGGATVPRAGGAAGAGGTQPRGFDVLPRGFGGMGRDMAAAPSYTVNVSFGVVGDERRAARMIRDVLERGR
jgi:hypothetical protein